MPIHRIILAVVSKAYAVDRSKQKLTAITLSISDGETIRAVVDYCYRGYIDITEENVLNYLQVADDLGIDSLQRKCQDFIMMEMQTKTLAAVRTNPDVLKQVNDSLMAYWLSARKNNKLDGPLTNLLLDWYRIDTDRHSKHMPRLLRMIPLESLAMEVRIERKKSFF